MRSDAIYIPTYDKGGVAILKIGLFILYGVLVFVVSLAESFLLSSGAIFKKEGHKEMNPGDWARVFILTFAAALMAGLAPVSGTWGIIVFIMALGMMGYVCFWASTEVSEVKELLVAIFLCVIVYFITKMGAIASGAVVRDLRALKFLRAVPGIALVICIAIMIASMLNYRGNGGHHEVTPAGRRTYKAFAGAVLGTCGFIVTLMIIAAVT